MQLISDKPYLQVSIVLSISVFYDCGCGFFKNQDAKINFNKLESNKVYFRSFHVYLEIVQQKI